MASLLPALLEDKQTILKNKLTLAIYISLMVEIWTDRRRHVFLGITAHVLEKN